jgi:hypothetical protein
MWWPLMTPSQIAFNDAWIMSECEKANNISGYDIARIAPHHPGSV